MDCCMINSFTAMADLVCLNMRTFSDGLSSGQFTLQQKSELRDIIVRLQDLEHYIKELTDIYYWRTLTLPLLTTWSVSLGMFAQMMVNGTGILIRFSIFWAHLFYTSTEWISFGIRVRSVYLHSVFCLVLHGKRSYQNGEYDVCFQLFLTRTYRNNNCQCEQIETELYKINWDLMPPQYRKMLVVVLNRWQVGCNITIGPLDVLNYETASTVSGNHSSSVVPVDSARLTISLSHCPDDEEDLFLFHVAEDVSFEMRNWSVLDDGGASEHSRLHRTLWADFFFACDSFCFILRGLDRHQWSNMFIVHCSSMFFPFCHWSEWPQQIAVAWSCFIIK